VGLQLPGIRVLQPEEEIPQDLRALRRRGQGEADAGRSGRAHRQERLMLRAALVALLLSCSTALAVCGPDKAPAPAAAHGFTCEVF